MSRLLILITISTFLINCLSLFQDQAIITQIHSLDDYDQLLGTKTDYLSGVLFCSFDIPNYQEVEQIYIELSKRVEGLIQLYVFNCDTLDHEQRSSSTFSMCANHNKKDLPLFIFIKTADEKTREITGKLTSSFAYVGGFEVEALVTFTMQLLPNYRELILTEDQLQAFLNKEERSKVILYTDSSTTPPEYKALTSEFKKSFWVYYVYSC